MSSRSSKSHASALRAFTLLEVLVSIGIMLVIISVVIPNQSTYSKGASLKNLANDIALTVRQAQVYGTSVQGFKPGAASTEFTDAYGVYFNIVPSTDPLAKTTFTFFADRPQGGQPKNKIYDSGPTCPTLSAVPDSECIQKIPITGGNQIEDLCLIAVNGSISCSNVIPIGGANISFLRPNTDASIVLMGNSSFPGLYFICTPTTCKGLRIKLLSPSSATSSVDVYMTGQISVH
ncbi:MAG: hypothetical protein JWN89_427 [Parcubacteria group bacterium]|nr:hypothetical protein [Parcubacteria group bacterium]